jgi:hypothetical protein
MVNVFFYLKAIPDAPTGVNITGQTPETVHLAWNPPANEGGSKITGYAVEMCEGNSDEWLPVNDALIKGPSYTGRKKRALIFLLFKIFNSSY